MASELHLELAESATRKSIFGQLVSSTPEAQRSAIGVVVGNGSIPEKAQLHDLAAVEEAIDASIASDWAKEQAKQVYRILAQAEGTVHGLPVEQTHFHEVGQGMTVREILGMCVAVEQIAPDTITATKIQAGSGTVECEHGVLDVPAPATAAILERYAIPVCDVKLEGELCTPTSAAFIAHFVEDYR